MLWVVQPTCCVQKVLLFGSQVKEGGLPQPPFTYIPFMHRIPSEATKNPFRRTEKGEQCHRFGWGWGHVLSLQLLQIIPFSFSALFSLLPHSQESCFCNRSPLNQNGCIPKAVPKKNPAGCQRRLGLGSMTHLPFLCGFCFFIVPTLQVKWQTWGRHCFYPRVFTGLQRWWLHSMNWKSLSYTNAYANAWPVSSDGRMNKQLLANTRVWHFNEVITKSLAIISAHLRWGVCGLRKRNAQLCFKKRKRKLRNFDSSVNMKMQKYTVISKTLTHMHTHITTG